MKIYLYCVPAGHPWGERDVLGFALAEDGTGLASHLSSGRGFSQHDMGLTSDWKHDLYEKHYPDGYKLEWIDDFENHDGLKQALLLNRAKAEAPQTTPSDPAGHAGGNAAGHANESKEAGKQ